MRDKIIIADKEHLERFIKLEIEKNGNECDLNHLDVSNVTNMSYLFQDTKFNGDISQWDVSNVRDMHSMFGESKFNGDISKWDVSNLEDMSYMFSSSLFNKDILKWDVSKVSNMYASFNRASFNGDLTNWKPYELDTFGEIFSNCKISIPYWAKFEDKEQRKKAIDSYILNEELKGELSEHRVTEKKLKI